MLCSCVCAGTVPHGIRPILVFVNTKSGPQKGWKLRRKFLRLLHPLQVNSMPLPDVLQKALAVGVPMIQTNAQHCTTRRLAACCVMLLTDVAMRSTVLRALAVVAGSLVLSFKLWMPAMYNLTIARRPYRSSSDVDLLVAGGGAAAGAP